jgi:hypothetical protein
MNTVAQTLAEMQRYSIVVTYCYLGTYCVTKIDIWSRMNHGAWYSLLQG